MATLESTTPGATTEKQEIVKEGSEETTRCSTVNGDGVDATDGTKASDEKQPPQDTPSSPDRNKSEDKTIETKEEESISNGETTAKETNGSNIQSVDTTDKNSTSIENESRKRKSEESEKTIQEEGEDDTESTQPTKKAKTSSTPAPLFGSVFGSCGSQASTSFTQAAKTNPFSGVASSVPKTTFGSFATTKDTSAPTLGFGSAAPQTSFSFGGDNAAPISFSFGSGDNKSAPAITNTQQTLLPTPTSPPLNGEESETLVYTTRVKVYRYDDSDWKESGVGNLRLLKTNDEPFKFRVTVRRESTFHVLLNLKLCASTCEVLLQSEKFVQVVSVVGDEDVKEGEGGKIVKYLFKVKDGEELKMELDGVLALSGGDEDAKKETETQEEK